MDKYIELLAESSHEIRTPLNSLTGMLELLQEREELKSDAYLLQAISSAEQLRLMINEILDLARLEKGNLKLRLETIEMNEIQSYIQETFIPMANKKNITLICDNREFDVEFIQGDEYRIKQIIRHLLSNAVQYTNSGGTVHYYLNTKKSLNEEILFQFKVMDNGVGMNPEFIEKLGYPLVHNDIEHFHTGLGIGLAITKRLIDLANGQMSITSSKDFGTTVTVSMNVRKASRRKKLHMIVGSGLDYEQATYANRTALVVEDHPVNQKIICKMLQSLGLQIISANDGVEALHQFGHSKAGAIDIIFMDLRMPNMNGIEATKNIRKLLRKDARTVPIVAMTASEKEEDGNKAIQSGMNYYMVKPCDKNEIQKILAIEFLNS